MEKSRTLFLKKTPFLKILPAFIGGILFQWYFGVNVIWWWVLVAFALSLLASVAFFSLFTRYKLSFISGFTAAFTFIALGALLVHYKDVRNDARWAGNYYISGDAVCAVLNEPLTEKTKSYKATAAIKYIVHNGKPVSARGTIIVYIRKDSLPPDIEYGSQIVFYKPLQEIRNSGNPNGFDYKRYSLFQGITHEVFLKAGEYEIQKGKSKNAFSQFIFSSRARILSILRTYIPGTKEQGLAEALLIGYKNDLDQALVQSYTNTGVVHIIAISGLHLGLIYWLLGLIAKPLQRKKRLRWLSPVFIIAGLWLFSWLAGAQPSVLRSALMFTCIVIGQNIGLKTNSIFNTLSVSAFILLCINPFWLWDVGFQLSYAAVLSIIIFMRPIYNLFYFKNKALDLIWKLNAVTLAAQILTIPISIYHFHQFPNYFLLTNFVAVPLSSLVVLGEILLCTIAFIPLLAAWVGKALQGMIWLMNTWVERVEAISFSIWDGLYISMFQTILLIAFIAGLSWWLMSRSEGEKPGSGLKPGLLALLGFVFLRSLSFINAGNQQKIIVYNVPQRRAIDLIDGRHYYFCGDSDLLADAFPRNFHLKPSRIYHRVSPVAGANNFFSGEDYISFHNKKILLLDSAKQYIASDKKAPVDLLIISKNPRLYIARLSQALDIKQVVFDGSCPSWKVNYWKKDCDSLHIPWYDVTEKGAFEMTLR